MTTERPAGPKRNLRQGEKLTSFRNLSLAFASIGVTTACTILPQPTHYIDSATPDYDPASSARIRILTGNGTGSASFRPGESCYKRSAQKDDSTIEVGDGYLASWKYSSRSIVIGMPASPRPWMTPQGLQFKDFIREYVVPAGKPVTFAMSYSVDVGNVNYHCRPPVVTFSPKPGESYDIFLENERRTCRIAARRIDGEGLDEPVALSLASKCPVAAETQ
jgi:hypothetical protein